ncbi:PD-(D/E)XK nuclease family protein [Nocardia sp. CA-129566]|uniref:PD-(D/E)XK nuclease family protein n=1 Tax=Nocardia sp. CA-129566 TaxID=3239976 RepID=UPI003D98B801
MSVAIARVVRSDSAVRLVRRNVAAPPALVWGADVRALFDAAALVGPIRPGWRPWQVLGGPGTGKTALLIDLAAERIAAGADPESVLVLTHSKRAASTVRDAITARLSGPGTAEGGVPGATREPLVRTLHSYAFSVLRRHASAHGNPPPRLLTGAEQDAVVREMLRGDLTDIAAGAGNLWPERLQPALGLGGFAEQLRDLMLRATERGLGPEDLVRLGREHGRPEWVAAGKFAVRYEQSMLLRWSVGVEAPEATAPALDAAELVGAALDALAGDADLLAAERNRIRYLLVDDAQHVDPQAALLIEVMGTAAHTAVVAGDPDQGVFAFRGADPRFVADLAAPDGQRIILRDNHRSGGQVQLAVARIAAKLPGSAPQRFSAPGHAVEPTDDGTDVRVRVLATPAKEAALIADHLRRAHLTDGVAWSRMAVIVRSVPLSLAPLRRALLAAGVPVQQPALDTPLARRRGAAWMLLALRAVLAEEAQRRGRRRSAEAMFSAEDALDLLAGPLGGADQITLRRLRRGIRRSVLESARSEVKSALGRASSVPDGEPDWTAADFPLDVGGDLPPDEADLPPGEADLLADEAGVGDNDVRRDIATAERSIGETERIADDADWYGIEPEWSLRESEWQGERPESDADEYESDSATTEDTGAAVRAAEAALDGPDRLDEPNGGATAHRNAAESHTDDAERVGRRADQGGAQPQHTGGLTRSDKAESSPDDAEGIGRRSDQSGAERQYAGSDGAESSFDDVEGVGRRSDRSGAERQYAGSDGAESSFDDVEGVGRRSDRSGAERQYAGSDGAESSFDDVEGVGRRSDRSGAERQYAGSDGAESSFDDVEGVGRRSDRSGAERQYAGSDGAESSFDDVEGVGRRSDRSGAERQYAGSDGAESSFDDVEGVGRRSDHGGAQARNGGQTGSDGSESDPADTWRAYVDKSSAEVLRDLLVGRADRRITQRLTDVEAAPLKRVFDALDRAAKTRRRGAGLEDVLWALWTGSRLERRWVAQSERGGAAGMQADRDLDAAVGLFDAAAAYVDRLPRASIEGFVEYLVQQEIPHDTRSLTAPGDAVALLSAHASAGREWDVVAVAAVQEGIWPNPRPRGTLLQTEDLVDLTAGIIDAGDVVSRAAPIMAEERRLLLVACSRARRSLLVTAVESVAGERDLVPSRFLAELLGHDDDSEPGALPIADPGRALVMHALVAELRGVVCDAEADPARRRRAAHQLARLAHAGVPGTHPDEWYGTADLSSSRSLWNEDDTAVALSPSTVELLRTCPLRWALERHGGTDGDNPHAVKGNLVHTLVQALAGKVPESQVRAALDRAWQAIDPGTGWHSRQELRRTEAMLETFMAWVRNTRGELTQAGVEVPVDCVLPPRTEDERAVRIRGRVDRLERDAFGRFVIVDVKTGKSPVTKQAAADHAQLATYQVAAAAGALDIAVESDPARDESDPARDESGSGRDASETVAGEPGGGRLVYVAKPSSKEGATQRMQPALDAEALEKWRGTIHDAAAATQGPSYLAMRNDGCRHCSVAGSCPVQDTGRQVTDE